MSGDTENLPDIENLPPGDIENLPDIFPTYVVYAKFKPFEKTIGRINAKLFKLDRKIRLELEFIPDLMLSALTGHRRFYYMSECKVGKRKITTQKAVWVEEKRDKVIKREFQKGDWVSAFLNFLRSPRKQVRFLGIDFQVQKEKNKITVKPKDIPMYGEITFEFEGKKIKRVIADLKLVKIKISAE